MWGNIPEEYRGEGFAGAMANAGYAEKPQDAWSGNLKPGAILQMWNSQSDYEGIKRGIGFDNSDINSQVRNLIGQSTMDDGHSAIFMGYTKFLGVIIGIKYADQSGEKSISRLNPAFRVIRGSNLKDNPSKQ